MSTKLIRFRATIRTNRTISAMSQTNPRLNCAIANHQPQSWMNELYQRLNELIIDGLFQSWMCASNHPIQPPHRFTFVNSRIRIAIKPHREPIKRLNQPHQGKSIPTLPANIYRFNHVHSTKSQRFWHQRDELTISNDNPIKPIPRNPARNIGYGSTHHNTP